MSEYKNLSKDNPFGWTALRNVLDWDEDTLTRKLKTTATLDASTWSRLGRYYLRTNQVDKAEIAFLGARYCDYSNKDLMREWLGVFSFLRTGEGNSEKEVLALANRINEGLLVVVNEPTRQISELQHLLTLLDNDAMRKV